MQTDLFCVNVSEFLFEDSRRIRGQNQFEVLFLALEGILRLLHPDRRRLVLNGDGQQHLESQEDVFRQYN